jgi:hypothetical protein
VSRAPTRYYGSSSACSCRLRCRGGEALSASGRIPAQASERRQKRSSRLHKARRLRDNSFRRLVGLAPAFQAGAAIKKPTPIPDPAVAVLAPCRIGLIAIVGPAPIAVPIPDARIRGCIAFRTGTASRAAHLFVPEAEAGESTMAALLVTT